MFQERSFYISKRKLTEILKEKVMKGNSIETCQIVAFKWPVNEQAVINDWDKEYSNIINKNAIYY